MGKIIENLKIVTKLKDFRSIFQDFCFGYAKKKYILSYCPEVKIFHLVFWFSRPMLSLRENQGRGKKTKVIYG